VQDNFAGGGWKSYGSKASFITPWSQSRVSCNTGGCSVSTPFIGGASIHWGKKISWNVALSKEWCWGSSGKGGLCRSKGGKITKEAYYNPVTVPPIAMMPTPAPGGTTEAPTAAITTYAPTSPLTGCEGVDPGLIEQYQQVCDTLYPTDLPYMNLRNKDCLYDLCVTEDPEIVMQPLENLDCEDYIETLPPYTDLEEAIGFCVRSKLCPGGCFENLGHGKCDVTTSTCKCNPGYDVSSHCLLEIEEQVFMLNGIATTSQTDFVQASALDPKRSLDAHDHLSSQSLEQALLEDMIQSCVEDTVLIYTSRTPIDNVASNITRKKYSYQLRVQADCPGLYGGSLILRFQGPNPISESNLIQTPNTVSILEEGKLRLEWSAYQSAGFIIQGLPVDYAGSIILNHITGVDQILVGSRGRNNKIDVRKIEMASPVIIPLSGEKITKECAAISLCNECIERPECGFCKDNEGKCMWGDVSGPFVGECNRWRHNFQDGVSRMVTSYWNPTMTEDVDVFLATVPSNTKLDDLPVRVSVDPGDIDSISWNIILAFQASRNSKEWNGQAANALGELSTFADDFPYTSFKIASFNDASDNAGKIETRSEWVPLLGTNHEALRKDMSRIKYSPWDSATGQLNMLYFAGDASLSHFSNSDSKRGVIIFARDKPLMDDTAPPIQKIRTDLIEQDIMPVFAVPKDLMQDYQNIINEIGFGAVVEIVDGTKSFASVIYRALNRIRGDVSVFPLEGFEGHLHMPESDRAAGKYKIKGLKNGFRARFEVPMKGRSVTEVEPVESILRAPGFGMAKIENVLNDRPVATAANSKVRPEDDSEFLAEFGFNGTWIILPGKR